MVLARTKEERDRLVELAHTVEVETADANQDSIHLGVELVEQDIYKCKFELLRCAVGRHFYIQAVANGQAVEP